MPDLFDVACHFDDLPANDAYTGVQLFMAQVSSFDESSPDGNVTKRRTLSVRPGTTIPSRRAITFLGEAWVVGDGNSDGIFGQPIRTVYWMKKSAGLFQLLSPSQLLANTAGTTAHFALAHKADKLTAGEVFLEPEYEAVLARTETVTDGTFLKLGSRIFLVRGTQLDEAGFLVTRSAELEPSTLSTVSITSAATYDPITETYTGSTTNVPGLLIDAAKLGSKRFSDNKVEEGDRSLVTATAPTVGTTVTVNSKPWRVLETQPHLDAFIAHVRRV